jgi:glycosyltransferase involved in cell wall biosynthesis
MKIFYWSPFNSRTGVVEKVINSIEAIKKYSKNNINITLLNAAGEWNDFSDKLDLANISLLNLSSFKFKYIANRRGFFWSRFYYLLIYFFCYFPLYKNLKKEKPDYLFCQLITSLPLTLSIFFFKDIKFILNISGFPKINFFRKFFWKIISKNIYKVCCPTMGTLNYILSLNIFDSKKVILLRDPIVKISEINCKKKEKISSYIIKNNYILSIGRLTEQKNHQLLIRAFKRISIYHPDLKLIIIGDGEKKEELLNLIKFLDMQQKILLIGYKNNIYKYIKNSLCVVSASLWEDPGFVMIMSAACSKIFISSNCPSGPVDFVGLDEKAGYLFENNNLEDLTSCILRFLNDSKASILSKMINAKKRSKYYTIFSFFLHFKKNFLNTNY